MITGRRQAPGFSLKFEFPVVEAGYSVHSGWWITGLRP
jgi:hypothetical protein